MRPALLAACALLVAAPAWAQEKEPEDPRAEIIDALMDGVSIIRCDDNGRPMYLPFTTDGDGNDQLSAWYLDGKVSFLGGYAIVEQNGRMLVISRKRMIVVTDKSVQEFPCRSEKLELQFLLTELRMKTR